MKTPRFWYPPVGHPPSLLASALVPFSWVFRAGTWVRKKLAEPYHAHVPLVCVGNAVAGGAGKTPTALALAQILKDHGEKPVFVTRGTGGHGELTCVDPAQHDIDDVGDEALLLAETTPTWAAHDRVEAIRQAEAHGSIIIMDDGFQNPHVAPTASLLVVDGDKGIGNGHIIPAGPLRESFDAALSRASAIILIGDKDRQNLAARATIPVFRAKIQPMVPMGFPREGRFVAFAGIAHPEKFYATARSLGLDIIETRDFPDHYAYEDEDIESLRLQAEENGARLLTTTKDAVRLPPDFREEVIILPVRLVFADPGAEKALAGLCGAKL